MTIDRFKFILLTTFRFKLNLEAKAGDGGGGDALEKIIITGCGNCIALASALLFWSLDPPLTFDSVLQCRRLLRKPPAEFPRGCGNRPSLLPSLKLGTIYQLIPHLTNSRNYHILEELPEACQHSDHNKDFWGVLYLL